MMQTPATDTAHHSGASPSAETNVHRVPGFAAFTATTVLSQEECSALVAAGEAATFWRSGEAGGPYFVGNRTRATIMDPSTAAIMFDRRRPVLPKSHRHDQSSLNAHHLCPPSFGPTCSLWILSASGRE